MKKIVKLKSINNAKMNVLVCGLIAGVFLLAPARADEIAAVENPAGPNKPADKYDEFADETPGAGGFWHRIFNRDSQNITCEGSLCKLFSVNVHKQSFTVTTYVGDGMPMMPNSGTNYYIGSGQNQLNQGKLGYGIMITWDRTNCSKVVNVDKSVYDAVTTYMKQLVNSKPGEDPTYPAFTPAEQTVILFYTTVMELVKGSTCN